MDVRYFNFLVRQPSARLLDRPTFWGMPKRGIALLLVNALFWQPFWAQAQGIAVSGGTNTTLGQAGNGVPIVNIAAPNATGLSHNQYQQYNVGAEGVILNNATGRTQSTQLGGIIVGNSNLKGNAASTILNEVTGANATQLQGYTEVAGQAARVIVANPYGISCNGCGFINTPRATLTTGKPVLDANGQLDHLQVDGGNVSIDGNGLDASTVDQFEIITRAAQINAQINAKQLAIVAGRNDVDAQTLNATARADDGSAKPSVAIDSSALGGMYAGAIKLVGTEAGVGVKVAGNLAASAGDIQIDANGQLNIAQVAASGAVNVKAANADFQGKVYASSVDVQTGGALNVQQDMAARDRISLASGGQLTNTAIIEAGVNVDNGRNGSGDVALSAQGMRNAGSVNASRSLSANVNQALDNRGGTLSSQGTTQINAASLDNRAGRVLSQGNLRLDATRLDNRDGEVSALGDLAAIGSQADNSGNGQLLANGDISLAFEGLNNHNNGTISSQRDVTLSVQQLSNNGQGIVYAKRGLTLTATSDVNNRQGALRSDGTLNIHATTIDNTAGNLAALGSAELTASDSIYNDSGTIASGAGLAVMAANILSNQHGELTAGGTATLTSTSLNNAEGRIAGQDDLRLQAGRVNQQKGKIVAQGALSLTANTVDNRSGGLIGGSKALALDVAEIDNRGGEISGKQGVTLSGQQLDNSDSGKVIAGTDLALSVTRIINHDKGLLFGNTVRVQGVALDNSGGTLASDDGLKIDLIEELLNRAGLISSEATLGLTAASLDNRTGSLSSAGALSIDTRNTLTNQQGDISTDSILTVATGSLDNRNQGTLSGKLAATVRTGAFNNSQGGKFTSNGTLALNAGQVTNQDGRIAAAQSLSASVTGLDQQGGELFSQGTLTLDLNHGQLNNQNGLINAPGALLLRNLAVVDNRQGEISSASTFDFAARDLDNSNGKLLSDQTLIVRVAQALANVRGAISAAAINADSGTLDNTEGLFSSRGMLSLDVADSLLNDHGTLIADGALRLDATTVDNANGQIASKQALTASIGNLQQNGGQVISLGTLDLTGARLDNRADGLVSATSAMTLNVDDVDNRDGELSSQGDISLAGQRLDNSDGGRIIGQQRLGLTIDKLTNRNGGLVSGATGLTLRGTRLDNSGGSLLSQHMVDLGLTGAVLNDLGMFSSEGTLNVRGDSVSNRGGTVSSASTLAVNSSGIFNNQGGKLVTDGTLDLHSGSIDNTLAGNISGKGPVQIQSEAFDNSHNGRLSSADTLQLTTTQLSNRDGGSIGSNGDLVASVSALDQQGASLFSNANLSLDMNHGQLDNLGGLINTPGVLLLRNLAGVNNQGGEISSAQGFTFEATSLDNAGGKLLSNQDLIVRVAQALGNVKGMIAATSLAANAGSLDNSGGTLTSRGALTLSVDGLLANRDAGLIHSQGALELAATKLDSSNGGEVSAIGDMSLALHGLIQNGGRLLGDGAVALNLNGGDFDNENGLISAKGPLTVAQLQNLNNQAGEISSTQGFALNAHNLNNNGGKLISSRQLLLSASQLLNQAGLISGWEGLGITAATLDNRNSGTLSSRSGDVNAALSGVLLNGNAGALVSQKALTVTADSVDNRGGILSSGNAQALNVTGMLDNSQNGLIDSGAGLSVGATTFENTAGAVSAQRGLGITATDLTNTAGSIAGNASVTLDLLGTFRNTTGKLASAGDLLLKRAGQVNNQGGQLASQGALTLFTGGLDNSNRGTVAANSALLVTATGTVQNDNDGLMYSKGASVDLTAAGLTNGLGTLQSQGALTLAVNGDIDNLDGKLIAQNGDLSASARNLHNRGGILSSLRSAFTTRITGVLDNGYDAAYQGGVIQAQSLDLQALAGIVNYGGRIAAQTGNAQIDTGRGSFDNRNGGLYAAQRISVISNNFDNSGDNDGQISGQQIDLSLAGMLNNRLGIIESASTLSITAASLDNRGGRVRALGGSGTTALSLSGALDNRSGILETANTDLILNTTNLLNIGGSLLHVGGGNFGLSTANVLNAGGSLVTRGVLTLNADSWTNSSVIQAGTLNVNVGTFIQTAAGQLLAANALVGTGGTWANDGVLASDGTLSLNLSGGYSGNGQTTSLGALGLTASQLALGTAGRIAGGARTDMSVLGQMTSAGSVTSGTDLFVNAGGIANNGTLGSASQLTLTTPTLDNQGLLFSGKDMVLNAGSFTNHQGDLYALGSVAVAGFGTAQANQVSNISGSMESGGLFAINAKNFENRTQGADAGNNFAVGRTLISGFIAVQCLDCLNRYESINYIARETFTGGQDNDTSASSLLSSGGEFSFVGGNFLNSKSTISAASNINIQADSFQNIGAVSGNIERTRIYTQVIKNTEISRFLTPIMQYNQRNNPDFPNVYYVGQEGELRLGSPGWESVEGGGDIGNPRIYQTLKDLETGKKFRTERITYTGYETYQTPVSQYDPSRLLELPTALTNLTLVSDVEVAKDGSGNAGRSAVIQAGGKVSITATQDLQNSVIHEDYAAAAGTNKALDTHANGTGSTVVVRLNAQLPPQLSQQQINPLTLPGFTLPTGQSGLFRLSSTVATQADTTAQNWVIGGASISSAQRGSAAEVALQRNIQLGATGQAPGSVEHLDTPTRNGSYINVDATELDTSILLPSGSSSTIYPSGTVQPALSATAQTVARVQGLPVTTGAPNANKYLIETNPVLTNLKQFMSSDYLLSGVGYDPDQSAKRLGDGLYEQRLVQQAITARTGQAFIDGQTSNEAQFKYLMNNAIASKEALNLSVGVSLTSEQVAALTHDIVWLEEQEVNGEEVLVPVVYLAQASGRLGPTGALIAGNDVTLIAGNNLDNVGTLKATNNLAATAAGDMLNSGVVDAGNRLDLLAGNTITNKAGGIIAGRDVSATAVSGDVINERSNVALDSTARGQLHKDYADSAARIEAANDLSVSAGRDISNRGSVLQTGRDLTLSAGRDVNIASTEVANSLYLNSKHNSSDTTQLGSTVTAGRDLSVQAGRDLNVIASQLEAKRDIALAATGNLAISSAADEEHSLSKSKKVTRQEDHVSQVGSTITAGGSLAASAGQDMTITSSRLAANDEAYLVAGGKLDLLAAQDSDYSLYSKKKKGHFGAKKTKRDEVTQVTNIGSEVKTGADLLLVSGGDQTYQAAKLDSGRDLTLNSGGAIAFEGVKDLHQESHEKSNSSLAWTSAKGKGNTDETLRQSELVAKGDVAINAVNGLHIDVKQVSQQTVSQAIDAMVKADPQLAWLKDAEKRGDVDWRQVKEIHDSFKYSQSGLGAAAQLAIAIVIAYFTAGAASGLVASAAGAGGTAAGAAAGAVSGAAAGGAAGAATTASVWAAASAGVSAGWANVAATAALTSAASNAAISTINNRGNLALVFKDVTSTEAVKGYAVGAIAAGLTAGLYDKWTGTQTGTSTVSANTAAGTGALANSGAVAGAPLNTLSGIGKFAANQVLQNATSTAVGKVLGQEGSFGDALRLSLANTFAAAGFNWVGNTGFQHQFAPGSLEMVGLHALVGGLAAAATGGDFKAGAIAGGASEALVKTLDDQFAGLDPAKRNDLLVLTTQLVGIAAAATVDKGDGKAVETGAWVAKNGTQYNYLSDHQQQLKDKELKGCKSASECLDVTAKWIAIDLKQDAGLALGAAASTGIAAKETAEGIVSLIKNWSDTEAIFDQLYESDEFRQKVGSAILNDFKQRVELMTQAYNDAGWDGSITAGVEAGKLAGDLLGLFVAAKGVVSITARLPSAASKVVGSVTDAIESTKAPAKSVTAADQTVKPATGSPAWDGTESAYSENLSGSYTSGSTTVNGQVVQNAGDFGAELGRKAVEIAPGKFDYLFGRVASSSHNSARSNQLALEMKRLGVPDNAAGRQMLTEHLSLSANTDGNVMSTYSTQYGKFEIRESLFIGPSGKAANFQSTFQVLDNGTRKLSTVIPLH
ncbi:two-partner secretion domain-containing protein [Pseudomonas japonica]|uniref:two-partner secretion domain-containing protein n=1 Tax=Pseudomonas japonica TaxID=256466 RepID=UPI0015E28677|nr:filamentous hemagglutinin N-terminal domain-containing protein [Pseudomonas japonica]MBA1243846.1 filamentous hemagglutinin N-terminal domain-containing protein [Pseudomonas japonica]